VIALSLLTAYVLLAPPLDRSVIAILLPAILMLIWGVIDDRIALRPYLKLLAQSVVALLLIWAGVRVQVTRILALDAALSVLWFVGMINAFNFVDSMDGLALGMGCIACAFFMLVTLDSAQPHLSVLAATVLGAGIGLFFYNASPAGLFLGDSGAQLLGVLLAAIGVAYVPANAGLPQGVSWFTPILVLGVPIFDMTLVVFSRLMRNKPVYAPARDHTYHRLLHLGLDSTRSVLAMQLTGILLGLTAFIALDATVLVANLVFGAIVALGVIAIVILERFGREESLDEVSA
jgi:UDP-GlcNAc:undecaprenyl-phosphate GlcNAc-1-phosphate transferase